MIKIIVIILVVIILSFIILSLFACFKVAAMSDRAMTIDIKDINQKEGNSKNNMKVYFINSQGKNREIGQCNTFEEGGKIIEDFLQDHKYKSYYTRVTFISETHRHYDVGSHTEFFEIKE